MPRRAAPLGWEIEDIVDWQDGLVTRRQALSAGVDAARIRLELECRRWLRVAPSVYLVGAQGLTPRSAIRAAWLWASPDAVVVGATALYWQGRRAGAPAVINLVSPRRARNVQLVLGAGMVVPVVVRRRRIDPVDLVSWNRLRTVRAEHAVRDLLSVEGPALLDEAIRRGWVSTSTMRDVHDRMPRGRGSMTAGRILTAAAGGAISEAERILHRELRRARITGWRANEPIAVAGRAFVGDAVFEAIRLVIEIDGFAFHTDHARFGDDRVRQNLLVAAGWTVLRFTWWQLVHQPDMVIEHIRATIAMLQRV